MFVLRQFFFFFCLGIFITKYFCTLLLLVALIRAKTFLYFFYPDNFEALIKHKRSLVSVTNFVSSVSRISIFYLLIRKLRLFKRLKKKKTTDLILCTIIMMMMITNDYYSDVKSSFFFFFFASIVDSI